MAGHIRMPLHMTRHPVINIFAAGVDLVNEKLRPSAYHGRENSTNVLLANSPGLQGTRTPSPPPVVRTLLHSCHPNPLLLLYSHLRI